MKATPKDKKVTVRMGHCPECHMEIMFMGITYIEKPKSTKHQRKL